MYFYYRRRECCRHWTTFGTTIRHAINVAAKNSKVFNVIHILGVPLTPHIPIPPAVLNVAAIMPHPPATSIK